MPDPGPFMLTLHLTMQAVIDLVREYNALGRHTLAIMLDTKGPEVRSGDVVEPLELATGASAQVACVCVCRWVGGTGTPCVPRGRVPRGAELLELETMK
jgi:hypothetical protein